LYHCPSLRAPENVPENFKMGYNEDRKKWVLITVHWRVMHW
jgi:hypothetical protein